eukprot:NODE_9257_length_522_cov_1.582278_g9234_i0.p2 GENE.NODE_9257_length_522_cov_1.582278_g9234_i0~~NODE_9257_length_522_cov_1.582278_g9234_i0.p2  ORF type:complete len:107 (+),score=28.71 NODE_9257_length_522_cov_1.582278_g9234_i0:189-509(+)
MFDGLTLQGGLHRAPGGVGGMNDAAVAVPAFPRQVKGLVIAAFRITGQLNAKFIKPFDGIGGIARYKFDGIAFAQSGTGNQGIFDMAFDAVGGIKNGGNPALRPVG